MDFCYDHTPLQIWDDPLFVIFLLTIALIIIACSLLAYTYGRTHQQRYEEPPIQFVVEPTPVTVDTGAIAIVQDQAARIIALEAELRELRGLPAVVEELEEVVAAKKKLALDRLHQKQRTDTVWKERWAEIVETLMPDFSPSTA